MRKLLIFTFIFELATGLLLIVLPSLLTKLLFDTTLDLPISLTVARVAGVAILSLSVVCWFARNDTQSIAARGIISAMLLYNIVIVLILIYAALNLSLSGIGLWPTILLHLAMSIWCIRNLKKNIDN